MVNYIFILYNISFAFLSLSKNVMITSSIKKNENITQYKSNEFYQPIIYINNQQHLFIL
jgi:hypothetical protein